MALQSNITAAACGILALLIGASPHAAAAQTTADRFASSESAQGSSDRTGLIPEPRVIERGIEFAIRVSKSGDGGEVKNGFYPELSDMITGAGWISAGPGYRHWLFGDRAFVDASAAVSWRAYKMAQVRFEAAHLARSRVAVGTQVRWQDLTQVTYFGEGPESIEGTRSEYRMTTANVVGYTVVKPVQWLSINGRFGWLDRPDLDSPAGTFRRGHPYTGEVFPGDPVFQLAEQPSYLHGETSIVADTRDERGYPSTGGMYRAAWTRFSDRDAAAFSFDRYEAEAAQFIPLAERRVVVALHAWLAGSGTETGQTVPFYLLPSLGGANTLRGYADYRFHDRSFLVLNAESRVAVLTHLDAAVFVDAGNVAPRVADLNLDRRSYGFGVRMHARQTTFARFDVARGGEGWRFLFRVNDPFRFGRLSRRTAAIPFVP